MTDAGYGYLAMDEKATRYGAVETRDEGRLYHDWLKSHEGEYDGVILCMPIFIDENGAVTALQDAGVPILMQACPDEIGKMDFAHRRDAFCGKFSVDVYKRQGQHTVRVLQIFRYTSHRKPRQRGYLFDVCHKAPSRRLWMDFYREITAG